jgi:site-specific DNA-methyltransferase (adenine-specific)
MKYLIKLITPPNGIILDPFCGSGTTLVAAGERGFISIGIDSDEKSCEIAAKRCSGSREPPAPP